MSQQKMRDFIEGISRLRIPGEIGCPDCGGALDEGNGFNRTCLNCGETHQVCKLDEWSADDAFDHQHALSILISDARSLLEAEPMSDPNAAAPDMLEALEEIKRNCEPWKTADNMAGRLFAIADRAITKARGQI